MRTILTLLPVLFGFFIMGFVDVVGIATSFVKQDFALNDTLANLLPMMVFLWFAVCSLPTGLLMDKTGRKQMVLISMAITVVAMLIPLADYTFTTMLIAFALLGIGNTVLQVSLNPLLADVVAGDKVTSMLTFGQFIKAVSSFLGPVLAGVAAGYWGNWKLIFPVYAVVSLLACVWLLLTPVPESRIVAGRREGHAILALLKKKEILVLFSLIVGVVGFEIGLMTAVPRYFLESAALPYEQGAWACSLYYVARTTGTLAGAIMLSRIPARSFMLLSIAGAIVCFGLFMVAGTVWMLMVCLFAVGLLCANVFAVTFAAALRTDTGKTNEISALMIMGVAGGALIPPVMGMVADATDQQTSLVVLLLVLIYLFVGSFFVIKNEYK